MVFKAKRFPYWIPLRQSSLDSELSCKAFLRIRIGFHADPDPADPDPDPDLGSQTNTDPDKNLGYDIKNVLNVINPTYVGNRYVIKPTYVGTNAVLKG